MNEQYLVGKNGKIIFTTESAELLNRFTDCLCDSYDENFDDNGGHEVYVRDIVKLYGDELIIQTTGKGKYGRWIGELYAQNMPHADMYKNEPEYETIANEIKNAMATGQDQTCNINDLMVSQGLAVYRNY